MSTHEWDLSHARSAAAFIAGLEAELVAAHHRIERLEAQVLIRDDIIDAVTEERDQAVDRCLAKYGRGKVTLHGFSGEWLPGRGETTFDDDLQGLA